MTLCQFNFLEDIQQLDFMNNHAVTIVARTDGDYEYRLLHVDSFFIEQKWNPQLNSLLSYTSFNKEEKLLPYIHAIDLWQLKYRMHHAGINH